MEIDFEAICVWNKMLRLADQGQMHCIGDIGPIYRSVGKNNVIFQNIYLIDLQVKISFSQNHLKIKIPWITTGLKVFQRF